MTIKELKKLIKGMPGEMKVVIGMGEGLEDICPISSQPVMIQYNDSEEKELLFILSECLCDSEDFNYEEGQVNSQPELN